MLYLDAARWGCESTLDSAPKVPELNSWELSNSGRDIGSLAAKTCFQAFAGNPLELP